MRSARIAVGAAGVLAIGYAIIGALTDPDERLVGHLAFLLAVQAAHDAILVPAALAVGVLVHRCVRGIARGVLQAGLLVTLTVLVVGGPLTLGFGRSADNPSALPLDYRRGVLVTLAAVWITTATILVIRARRRRRPLDGHMRAAPD
jgi:hypothetical protein